MNATVPSLAGRRLGRRAVSPRVRVHSGWLEAQACATTNPVGRYADAAGCPRELVTCPGAGGSVLVMDRDARTLEDRRLVAHLAPDEPSVNARIVCLCYLSDPRRALPRAVTTEDLLAEPLVGVGRTHRRPSEASAAADDLRQSALIDSTGCSHRLALVASAAMAIPELRWLCNPPDGHAGPAQVVSLREVIGRTQSYEPSRELTAQAVRRHRSDPYVSVAVLRAEHERVARSRIVLNRALREAVLRLAEQENVSMSRIATRCGRVKRDRRGNLSGETSWLARRLGLAPEGRGQGPTPWIHTDVLALIAREGLGVAPREVELA
jgi:hypothetical protein